jgi:hypothetical protein
VGIIVACVIGLVLVAVFAIGPQALTGQPQGSPRADGKGETIVGRAMLRAKDTDCAAQLSQVRQALMIQTDPVDNTRPGSLQEIQGVRSLTKCPVGEVDYQYNAEEGTVSCPHPGHEKY